MKFNKEKAKLDYIETYDHDAPDRGDKMSDCLDWLAEDIECPRCSRTLLPCSYCNNQRATPRVMIYIE